MSLARPLQEGNEGQMALIAAVAGVDASAIVLIKNFEGIFRMKMK